MLNVTHSASARISGFQLQHSIISGHSLLNALSRSVVR